MHKSCGKHVNNQRIERRTNCDSLSTHQFPKSHLNKMTWTTTQLIPRVTHITHRVITKQKEAFNRLFFEPFPHFPQSLLILRPYKYLKKG